jgi:unconventional prefoldin RPB5 interactor 1
MKYSGSKIIKKELEEFADVIQNIIRKETRRKEEKELGVSKALRIERKNIFKILSRLRKGEKRSRKKHIIELMKEEESALRKDMDIAKDIYHRILSSYYKLPASERKEVYNKLMNFYNEVNRMLFSSFYGKKSRKELEYFAKKLEKLKEETEKVEKVIREKPSEKVKEAIERLKLPEIKIKPLKEKKKHKKELIEERKREREELKKLEEIEKRAKERIKQISESVVKERMRTAFLAVRKEKRIIKKTKPNITARVMKREKPTKQYTQATPTFPIKHEEIKETAPAKSIESIKLETPKVDRELPVKRDVVKPVIGEIKKESIKPKREIETEKKASKKLGALEKEEQEIKERLERLRRYIG